MMEKCLHPKWTKIDVFQVPLKEIAERMTYLEANKIRAIEYLSLKKRDFLPDTAAELILNYLKKRIDLLQAIERNIYKYRDIEKTLEKLNKRARKRFIREKQLRELKNKTLSQNKTLHSNESIASNLTNHTVVNQTKEDQAKKPTDL